MRIAHFFIDRPRFATVVSAFLTLIGLGAMFVLAGRAVSGNRSADRAGHDVVSRRIRRDDRTHGRDAARAADQRRREHALHEQPVDRRRQAHGDRDVPHRHRSERRADADAKPRAGCAAAAARGRAAPGRAGQKIDAEHPARRAPLLARQIARHACICRTTRRCM